MGKGEKVSGTFSNIIACYSVALAKDSCGAWTRTRIHSSRGYSPTIRRPRNIWLLNFQIFSNSNKTGDNSQTNAGG